MKAKERPFRHRRTEKIVTSRSALQGMFKNSFRQKQNDTRWKSGST